MMTLSFNERINANKFNIIIDNFDELKDTIYRRKPLETKNDEKKELLKLKKIAKELKKNNGIFKSTYKYAKTRTDGRLFGNGLSNMVREIRFTIADEYRDVDIINCHPTLLCNMCIENNIKCECLLNYLKNRDEYKKEIPEIKIIMNSMINNGFTAYDQVKDKPEWLILLKIEMEKILGLFKEMYKDKLKKKQNALGTLMSDMLTLKESQILNDTIFYIKDNLNVNIENAVLCFDGFMLPKDKFNDEHLQKLNDYVNNKYNIKYIFKPMETLDLTNLTENAGSHLTADADCANAFYEYMLLNDHKFVRVAKEIWWYIADEGLWRVINKDNMYKLNIYLTKCDMFDTSKTSKLKSIREYFLEFIDFEDDPDFLSKINTTTYRKIPMKNGVYDFGLKKLVPYSSDYIFTQKLPFDYDPDSIDKELCNEIYKKLFIDIFGEEIADYYIKVLARAIAGEIIVDKNMFFITGSGNSGKGICTDMNTKTFKHLVKPFSTEYLQVKKASGDPAKAMSWMFELANCRLIVGNEIKMGDKIDGNMCKILSGGDSIMTRKNYVDEVEKLPQFTTMIFSQDIPEISPLDDAFQNRFVSLSTKYSYLSGQDYEAKKHMAHIKQADPTLKTDYINNPKVQFNYLHMVLDAYQNTKPVKPQCVIDEIKEWTAMETIDDKIHDLYEIGGENDFITCKAFAEKCKRSGIAVSTAKIGRILSTKGIKSKNKKVDGKCTSIYPNIKFPAVNFIADEIDL